MLSNPNGAPAGSPRGISLLKVHLKKTRKKDEYTIINERRQNKIHYKEIMKACHLVPLGKRKTRQHSLGNRTFLSPDCGGEHTNPHTR